MNALDHASNPGTVISSAQPKHNVIFCLYEISIHSRQPNNNNDNDKLYTTPLDKHQTLTALAPICPLNQSSLYSTLSIRNTQIIDKICD